MRWANFHCCKWSNIVITVWSSGHTVHYHHHHDDDHDRTAHTGNKFFPNLVDVARSTLHLQLIKNACLNNVVRGRWLCPMWPDVKLKSSPIFTKVPKKQSKMCSLKRDILIKQKSNQIFWLRLYKNMLPRPVKKALSGHTGVVSQLIERSFPTHESSDLLQVIGKF